MYIQSRYICKAKPRFQGGGTAWRCGFLKRSPGRQASMRAIVWRSLSTTMAPSFYALPSEDTSYQSLSLESPRRTATGKRTGDSPKARNPGEVGLRTRHRRLGLVDLPSASRPRAGREATCTGVEPQNIQREVWPGAGMS